MVVFTDECPRKAGCTPIFFSRPIRKPDPSTMSRGDALAKVEETEDVEVNQESREGDGVRTLWNAGEPLSH